MRRILNPLGITVLSLAALIAFVPASARAQYVVQSAPVVTVPAPVVAVPSVSYYAPPAVSYYAAPTVSYASPAVSYSYYPTTVYAAPAAVAVPAGTVTTRSYYGYG